MADPGTSDTGQHRVDDSAADTAADVAQWKASCWVEEGKERLKVRVGVGMQRRDGVNDHCAISERDGDNALKVGKSRSLVPSMSMQLDILSRVNSAHLSQEAPEREKLASSAQRSVGQSIPVAM